MLKDFGAMAINPTAPTPIPLTSCSCRVLTSVYAFLPLSQLSGASVAPVDSIDDVEARQVMLRLRQEVHALNHVIGVCSSCSPI